MEMDFLTQTLNIQIALGIGWVGYATAYAGYTHRHGGREAVFMSLAFSAIAALVFAEAEPHGHTVAALTALVLTLLAAILWRSIGRLGWHMLMALSHIHREDGTVDGWTAIVQKNLRFSQISVHTTDGRELYLDNAGGYKKAPWRGLNLGADGSITMVVETEILEDGTEETRQGITDPKLGTRLTYLPPQSIARVNFRAN